MILTPSTQLLLLLAPGIPLAEPWAFCVMYLGQIPPHSLSSKYSYHVRISLVFSLGRGSPSLVRVRLYACRVNRTILIPCGSPFSSVSAHFLKIKSVSTLASKITMGRFSDIRRFGEGADRSANFTWYDSPTSGEQNKKTRSSNFNVHFLIRPTANVIFERAAAAGSL